MVAADPGFVHEAFLYSGDDEFLAGTVPFIVSGVEADEPVMVAVAARKIALLRDLLEGAAAPVLFVDMAEIGANPACIIPAWQDFLAQWAPGGRPVRGIGEPINPERSPAALLECQRHEVLLNAAFAGRPSWWLLCPYDVTALQAQVIEEATRSHPYLLEHGDHHRSTAFVPDGPAAFAEPLPEPTSPAEVLHFGDGDGGLASVRRFVSEAAGRRGMGGSRLPDLLVAVNELATNSVCHGGGRGRARVWREGDELICEISDRGVITEPLAGRRRPDRQSEGGRGLWIVNQLCDFVEMRSSPAGTVVRTHIS